MRLLFTCLAFVLFVLPSFAMSDDILVRDKTIYAGSSDYYYKYNFGEVRIQWPDYAQVEVLNSSDREVLVHRLTTDGEFFTAYAMCPYELPPGGSCFITMKYEAFEYGEYDGQVRLYTSAGTYKINLHGATRLGAPPSEIPEPQGQRGLKF